MSLRSRPVVATTSLRSRPVVAPLSARHSRMLTAPPRLRMRQWATNDHVSERAERRQEFHGAVFLPTVIDYSGRLHMGINDAHLTASPVPVPLPLLTVFYLLLCLIAATTSMDRLPRGVHPDLPRDEFILNLKHFSVSDLNTLRLDLFNAASDIHSLIPPEWAGIPLVTRRDTAIKTLWGPQSKSFRACPDQIYHARAAVLRSWEKDDRGDKLQQAL